MHIHIYPHIHTTTTTRNYKPNRKRHKQQRPKYQEYIHINVITKTINTPQIRGFSPSDVKCSKVESNCADTCGVWCGVMWAQCELTRIDQPVLRHPLFIIVHPSRQVRIRIRLDVSIHPVSTPPTSTKKERTNVSIYLAVGKSGGSHPMFRAFEGW